MPLPVPVQRQREVVCLRATGHQVVLGTAGSGKTTMAILRAAYLADPDRPGHGQTLLLTFNKALGAYIRSIAAPELRNVQVEHYHRFARGYLAHRNLMGYNDIVRGSRHTALVTEAVRLASLDTPGQIFLTRPLNFFKAELAWLFGQGITEVADYTAVAPANRGESRLEAQLRSLMWNVRDHYLALRANAGFQYDFDDLASAVRSELEQDGLPRRYKHIVIDEGQDLSPEMLRSLARAIPADGSITFFGDVAQQIYGHRTSWRSAGLNPPRVWQFSENYRNTAEIAALGLSIANMPYYVGVVDMVAPTAPLAAGPKPTLVEFQDAPSRLRFLVDQASRFAQTQSVAVLGRTRRQVQELANALPNSAIALRDDGLDWVAGPSLYYGTYHSAKGLEFDAVIVPFASINELPDSTTIADFGDMEADASDGRLLYVAVTRARRALILAYVGAPTRLLPTIPGLYTLTAR